MLLVSIHKLTSLGMSGLWVASFLGHQKKLVMSGGAAVVWTIRKTNEACFKQQFPTDLATVFYAVCHLLDSWAIMQKERSW